MNKLMKFIRASMLWLLICPWAIYGMGAASNQLVLIANHDTFPVNMNQDRMQDQLEEGARTFDGEHAPMTPDSNLKLMSDIIDVHGDYLSIGDMFLYLGQWLNTFCPWVWGALVLKKLTSSIERG